jgi:hypothetical protein
MSDARTAGKENQMTGKFVDRFKPGKVGGPIPYEEMAEKIRNYAGTIRGDELADFWEYGDGADPEAALKQTSRYNAWAIKNGRLLLQSTTHYRPSRAEDVLPYRRKPKP